MGKDPVVSSTNLTLATELWPEHLTVTADLEDGAYVIVDLCCRKALVRTGPSIRPGQVRDWIAMTPATPGAGLVMVWATGTAQHLGPVGRVCVDTGIGL